MRESYFKEIFTPTEIDGVKIQGNHFELCQFENCDLSAFFFEKTMLVDCVFNQCDLNNIEVESTLFRNVTFKTCKLNGIHFDL
ncbi:MAG: pentapeptide repeat-containing protein, partial [Bacteroidetes bacterium]|nr:pentapeptide repeat-containing protein [Bacteroidota bacterium]